MPNESCKSVITPRMAEKCVATMLKLIVSCQGIEINKENIWSCAKSVVKSLYFELKNYEPHLNQEAENLTTTQVGENYSIKEFVG